MTGFLESAAGALCHRLPHLTPTVCGAALLCYRCLGIYAGASLAAGYLILRRRLGRCPPRGWSLAFLVIWAAPLVVDEILVTAGIWSPPGWWRLATGALGGAALMTLGTGLLGLSWRRARARRMGGHLGESEGLVAKMEALVLPPAIGTVLTRFFFLGGAGLWTLEALGLTGALVCFATAGALLLSPWPPLTRRGRWGYGAAAAVLGLAVWTVLWLVRL